MKHLTVLSALAAVILWSNSARAEKKEQVTLYQVGSNGNYCLSITPNASGCVSGTTGDGDTINLMEFVKDKEVVFQNLSDAPHDMRFSGANAENIPPQNPNGDAAIKKLTVEDLTKNKITCSFHGAQLEVGYKVLGPTGTAAQKQGNDEQGHKDGADRQELASGGKEGAGGGAAGGAEGVGSGNAGLRFTGLADVSRQVLAKGSPAEVEKLVAARPELMEQLKELRPMLASELAPRIAALPMKGVAMDNGGLAGVGGAGAVGGSGLGQGGFGVPGAGAVAARGGAGGGSLITTTTGETDGEEDFIDENGTPRRRQIIAGGNAAVVRRHPLARNAGWVGNGVGGRGVASLGNGEPGSYRTSMKKALAGPREPLWKNGHLWLIALLALMAVLAARAVIRGTRKPA